MTSRLTGHAGFMTQHEYVQPSEKQTLQQCPILFHSPMYPLKH